MNRCIYIRTYLYFIGVPFNQSQYPYFQALRITAVIFGASAEQRLVLSTLMSPANKRPGVGIKPLVPINFSAVVAPLVDPETRFQL